MRYSKNIFVKLLTTTKSFKTLMAITMVIFLAACSQEIEENHSEAAVLEEAGEEVRQKIARLGFDIENYPVFLDQDHIIVEGDIGIPLDYLDQLDEQEAELSGARIAQRRSLNLVRCNEIRYITVYNNLPPGSARNAVSLAMRHWNEITKCNVYFAATNDIDIAEVIISNGRLFSTVIGLAMFPSGGVPGKYIRLDLNKYPNYSYAQWRSTIEHELGHAIGFAHTNSTAGETDYIEGTTLDDPNSLMNGGRGGTVRKLSGDDKKAARLMYNLNYSGRLCE